MNTQSFPIPSVFNAVASMAQTDTDDVTFGTDFCSVMRDAGSAYVAGLIEMGRLTSEYSSEAIDNASTQMRASFEARTPLEAGSLYLSYWQRRIDRFMVYSKELTLAAAQSGSAVTAPLLCRKASAA
ncbi:phasin family protein [Paracoccus sp. (in: a-proteobacteria)]|uniref:phasin family protein n=1 Tax=Paracoccus sp. TaxID=267 RepID=UPI003A84A428